MALRPFRGVGCFGALLFGVVIVLLVTALLAPWAFRIGGGWTLASWQGLGMLQTEAGDAYPLYIFLYPNFRSMSHLRMNGQRPSSGIHGSGWLCSAQGVSQRLALTGDIYGAYLSTDGNQMGLRLLDARRVFRINQQRRRYFDLHGRWHGPELVMEESYGWEANFHPDPRNSKEHPKITFAAGSFSDFKKLCAAATISEKARIAPPTN